MQRNTGLQTEGRGAVHKHSEFRFPDASRMIAVDDGFAVIEHGVSFCIAGAVEGDRHGIALSGKRRDWHYGKHRKRGKHERRKFLE